MKNFKHKKKIISLLLVLSLCIGNVVSFAEEAEEEQTEDTATEEVLEDTDEQRNNGQDQLEIKFNEEVNAETEVLNMIVDESTVVCRPTALWYGISDGEVGDPGGTENPYLEKGGKGPNGTSMNLKIIESFKNFKGTVGIARYGGTFANYVDWKKSVNAKWSDRKPYNKMSYDTDYEDADSDGATVLDFCKTFLAINEDIEFHICVNMTTDSEIDVADLVEFLEGDGVINHNGGENWAQKRIALGIKEPIKNICYELGNEIEWGTNIQRRDWTKENYVAVSRRFIAAIRSVNEDAEVSVLSPCALWSRNGENWSEWHRYILMELGDQVDVLDFHSYNSYRQAYVSAITVNSVIEDIRNITGENRIRIFQSESSSSSNTGKKYGYMSLAFGINITDYYYRIMSIPDALFKGAAFHSMTNLFRDVNNPAGDDYTLTMQQWDGSYINVPIGEARDFLSRFGVGESLKVELDGFTLDKPSWVSGAVVRQADGKLNVMLTNMSEVNDYYIDFAFDGKYKLVHSYIMTAPKLTSVVWRTKNEVEISEADYNTSEEIDKFLLKSKSMVCLQLEPISE